MSIEDLYQLFLSSTCISTDTRNLPEGCMYLALKGKNFNGNEFASDALTKGAKYAIVDEEKYVLNHQYILVPDGLKTLQQLATFHRMKFNIPVIGITGSNGKTTTKELLYAVLKQKFKTHVTQGNLNNHIGLPLTILSMPTDTEIAIIEMGANKVGDNAELCEIFNPNFGIITNIGKEHLEGFIDLEGVTKGNSELFKHLQQHHGKAFVNLQQEHVARMAARLDNTITYGVDRPDANFSAQLIQSNPSIILNFQNELIHSVLFGSYNAENIMTAIGVGAYFNMNILQIKSGVEAYIPANNRSQIIEKNNNFIIVDCYNANPSSMDLAIQNFNELKTPKPKVLILGDMYETGAYEAEEHQNLLLKIKDLNFDKIFLAGKAFGNQKHLINCQWFADSTLLRNELGLHPLYGYAIFIKGSRGMKMENVLEAL